MVSPFKPQVLLLLAFDEFDERTVETSPFLEAHGGWSQMVAGGWWVVAPGGGRDVSVRLCDQGIRLQLPKTNSSPLKMMVSNRNLLFQGFIFRGGCC